MEKRKAPYLKVSSDGLWAVIVLENGGETIDFENKTEGRQMVSDLLSDQRIDLEEAKQLVEDIFESALPLGVEISEILRKIMDNIILEFSTESDFQELCDDMPEIVNEAMVKVCSMCKARAVMFLPNGMTSHVFESQLAGLEIIAQGISDGSISQEDAEILSRQVLDSGLPD